MLVEVRCEDELVVGLVYVVGQVQIDVDDVLWFVVLSGYGQQCVGQYVDVGFDILVGVEGGVVCCQDFVGQ